MEIKVTSFEAALALAQAAQRLSPRPIEAGKIPILAGKALTQATDMLAKACLEFNPFERMIAKGIASGEVTLGDSPAVKRAKAEEAASLARLKARAQKVKAKKKKVVVKKARRKK